MRSVHIQKDKSIFKLSELPAEAYAASMGLPGAPQIKLLDKKGGRKVKERGEARKEEIAEVEVANVGASSDEEDLNAGGADGEMDEDGDEDGGGGDGEEQSGRSESDEEDGSAQSGSQTSEVEAPPSKVSSPKYHSLKRLIVNQPVTAPVRTKYDRMFERINQSILTPHYSALVSLDRGDADEIFTLARHDHALQDDDASAQEQGVDGSLISSEDLSKRKLKAGSSRKLQLKTRPASEKVVFDDEGLAREFYEAGKEAESGAGAEERRKAFVAGERETMRDADRVDREVARERKRERKRKRKEREREVGTIYYQA